MQEEVVVIGAGTVGAAIAYGLADRGVKVLVLDGGDRDFRAATANFGLVWQQGKGMDMPAYQLLTGGSLDRWPDFCRELSGTAGIDLQYERNGGLAICRGEDELEQRRTMLTRLHNQLPAGDGGWDMLDRAELEKLLPKVPFGSTVSGASLGRRDGAVNPLRLLAALHAGIVRKGGRIEGGASVRSIERAGQSGFTVRFNQASVAADRVVIAAGLGSKALGAQVGLDLPVRPQRGQILVTERVERFLTLPISGLRQTQEGTVLIGATHDDPGMDTSTTVEAAAWLSARAIQRVPALAKTTLVRQWAGLRIMTPDGHPIYAESETHPGAFVALCHSGVTLAATHADTLAGAIAAGRLTSFFDHFHQRRFDVPKAA